MQLRAVEKVDQPSFQRVFGTNNPETVLLNQLLQDFGSVAQVVGRSADVGPDSLLYKSLDIVLEIGGQQRLN